MPNNAVTIRAVSTSDAPAIADLTAELGYPAPVDTIRDRIQALSASPDHAIFVACLNDEAEVAGWIEIYTCRQLQADPYALISGLVVSEQTRNCGIGKQLFSTAEVWTRHRGLNLLRVRSRIAREQAHKFYLREGFHQTKTSAVFEKTLLTPES